MFNVQPVTADGSGLRPILSGIAFGFFEQPLLFDVKADGADNAFRVEVFVSRNKQKKRYAVEVEGTGELSARLSFFNPTEGGVSGLLAPVVIVNAAGAALALMFYVNAVNNGATAFQFSYQFFELEFSPSESGGDK